jgi:UDPglucose 6-dehydrogenase
MRVSVLGTGYLGATHAACLASWGHDVVGVDPDTERVELLATGRAPFREPGLDVLLEEGVASGRLRFGTDLTAATDADVHFICVGTPQSPDADNADLSAVWRLVDDLAPTLTGDCLVVGKSTVPVGTAAEVAARLRQRSDAGTGVEVAWNPEFLREGHAVEDSLRPDRIVLGVESDTAALQLRELYAEALTAAVPLVVTDLATAELAKVAANTMLAARISLVNMLSEVCEAADANVRDLAAILGHDQRIGSDYLSPGVGFGGGCLPKDIRAFASRAEELGVTASTELVHAVDAVNLRQRDRAVRKAAALVGGDLHGVRLCVLGAAFKAGSDDVRDSPALDVATRLRAAGADVVVHDPLALPRAERECPELQYDADLTSACRHADGLVVLTDWQEYTALDPVSLAEHVRHPRVLDARLALDADKWRAAGWHVDVMGS